MSETSGAELLWFLGGLGFFLAELILPGFVIVFFGIGAWITALLVGLGLLPSFNGQLLVFLGSSVLALVFLRRKGRELFQGKVTRVPRPGASMEDVRGERAVVIVSIVPNGEGGKVEFHGTLWNADADLPVEKGQVVEIVEQSNLRLKVKPIS
ncbi:MAG: NfeD family protein [Bacteroidota bacterium]